MQKKIYPEPEDRLTRQDGWDKPPYTTVELKTELLVTVCSARNRQVGPVEGASRCEGILDGLHAPLWQVACFA
jgi:hypothetical protein